MLHDYLELLGDEECGDRARNGGCHSERGKINSCGEYSFLEEIFKLYFVRIWIYDILVGLQYACMGR